MDEKIVSDIAKTLEKDKRKFLKLKRENERLKKRVKELVKIIEVDKHFLSTIEKLEEEIENIRNPFIDYTYSYKKGGLVPKNMRQADDETRKLEEINKKLRNIQFMLEKMHSA